MNFKEHVTSTILKEIYESTEDKLVKVIASVFNENKEHLKLITTGYKGENVEELRKCIVDNISEVAEDRRGDSMHIFKNGVISYNENQSTIKIYRDIENSFEKITTSIIPVTPGVDKEKIRKHLGNTDLLTFFLDITEPVEI